MLLLSIKNRSILRHAHKKNLMLSPKIQVRTLIPGRRPLRLLVSETLPLSPWNNQVLMDAFTGGHVEVYSAAFTALVLFASVVWNGYNLVESSTPTEPNFDPEALRRVLQELTGLYTSFFEPLGGMLNTLDSTLSAGDANIFQLYSLFRYIRVIQVLLRTVRMSLNSLELFENAHSNHSMFQDIELDILIGRLNDLLNNLDHTLEGMDSVALDQIEDYYNRILYDYNYFYFS